MQTTKRSISSTIAQIYDPLGALGPTTFWAMSLMQELWCQKLEWDNPAPVDVRNKWEKFIMELPLVKDVSVPRYINSSNVTDVQLIGFVDASQRGYAATIYLRSSRPY